MKNINIKNKKAQFDYEFIEIYTAGIMLVGTEIKSIRNSSVSFTDTYCFFDNGELFVKNLHISEYKFGGSHYNHEEKRNRKLLLNKRELKKINVAIKTKGLTVVPTRIFINEKGKCKLEIALAKGKKTFDKREKIKENDIKKENNRNLKYN